MDIARLTDEHKDQCQAFDCGPEPYQEDVNRYIRVNRWLHGRKPEHGLLASEEGAGVLVGFGAWKHAERTDGLRVIQIQYFGIHAPFQGAKLKSGEKLADAFYATLEADAFAHADSLPDMPVDLYCDTENGRGIAFWQRQGFGILGQVDGERPLQYHLMRRFPV